MIRLARKLIAVVLSSMALAGGCMAASPGSELVATPVVAVDDTDASRGAAIIGHWTFEAARWEGGGRNDSMSFNPDGTMSAAITLLWDEALETFGTYRISAGRLSLEGDGVDAWHWNELKVDCAIAFPDSNTLVLSDCSDGTKDRTFKRYSQ